MALLKGEYDELARARGEELSTTDVILIVPFQLTG